MTFLYATTPKNNNRFSIKKILKNINGSLRIDSKSYRHANMLTHNNLLRNLPNTKRSSLCTSPLAHGSITLEASICIPLFFLGLLTIIYIINIITIQLTLQIALEETIRDISKEAYISSKFYSMLTEEQANTLEDDSSILENIGATIISVPYVKHKFMNDDIKNFLDNSYVENGSDGISFKFSSVDMKNNIVDVVIDYKYCIPFIPNDLLSFRLSNRCYSRIYMGKDMEKEQKEAFFYIYYATTSSVVHTNKYCQYLLNYSKAIRYNEIVRLHPIDGCALCANDTTIEQLRKDDAIVYLTTNEDIYHITLDCQSFTGDIFRLKISSLENQNICKKCLEGK